MLTSFIELKATDGDPVTINLERVIFFKPAPDGASLIYFNEYSSPVRVIYPFSEFKKIIMACAEDLDSDYDDTVYQGSDYEEIVTCFLCHDNSESWVWVYEHEMKMKFIVCSDCVKSREKTGEIKS